MLPARLILLFLFAIVLDGFAQPLPERREISGRVSMTQNKPVLNAQVTIKRKDLQGVAAFWGAAVASNVAGEFSVPHVEEGDYEITVWAPGYEVWKGDYTLSEYSPPLSIVLQRKVSLTFTLLDANGKPVRGRPASVFGFVTQAGVWQADDTQGAALGLTSLSNRAGIGTLSNQSEGVYHRLFVLVRGVGYAVWEGKAQVLEGNTHHIELVLQQAPASLHVQVFEAAPDPAEKARPVGGAQLILRNVQTPDARDKALAQWLFRQNAAHTNALATKDGSGELLLSDLLPGKYEIRAESPFGCRPSQTTPPQTVEIVPHETPQRLFHLKPCQKTPVPLQLTLLDAKGTPLSHREVRFFGQPLDETTGMPMQAEESLKRQLPPITTRQGQTDSEGKITIYPFWAATWRFAVTELNADVPFRGVGALEVTPAGAAHTIEVSLRPIEEAE